MTINAAESSNSMLSASTSKTELTKEEKKYDADGDGVLSVTEKAAMLEAQAKEKALETSKSKSSYDSDPVSVSISQEGLEMQMQGSTSEPTNDVNEMSDSELKNMLGGMKEKSGQFSKELRDYDKISIDDLSDEDLSKIRKTMTDTQEKIKERMSQSNQSREQRLMNEAISEYKKFSSVAF